MNYFYFIEPIISLIIDLLYLLLSNLFCYSYISFDILIIISLLFSLFMICFDIDFNFLILNLNL